MWTQDIYKKGISTMNSIVESIMNTSKYSLAKKEAKTSKNPLLCINTRGWIPDRGKSYLTGRAVLAPEQMDINRPGIHLGCMIVGSFELSERRRGSGANSVAVAWPKSFELSKLMLLNSY